MVKAHEIKKALSEKHRKDFFMTEVKNGSTWMSSGLRILDAVAFNKSWANKKITGYEIKVSRSDFLNDAKYLEYLPLVHSLYFVVPNGLVKKEEVPIEVGLIYYYPETGALLTKRHPLPRKIEISVDFLLYIIYSKMQSDRYPFFNNNRVEYFKEWLAEKESYRELGHGLSQKIKAELKRLNDELARANRFNGNSRERKEYEEIMSVLERSGMPVWTNPAEWLRNELKRECPKEIESIEFHANHISRIINEAKEMRTGGSPNEADNI